MTHQYLNQLTMAREPFKTGRAAYSDENFSGPHNYPLDYADENHRSTKK